jgi:hypothetical protein
VGSIAPADRVPESGSAPTRHDPAPKPRQPEAGATEHAGSFDGAMVLLPFPTTMIGRFANRTTALVICAGTNVVAGGSLSLKRLRAERADLHRPGIPDRISVGSASSA